MFTPRGDGVTKSTFGYRRRPISAGGLMNDSKRPTPDTQARRKIPWKLVGFILFSLVIVLFVLQNRTRMNVNFLFFEVNSRQWVNLLVAVALGVIADRLFIGVRKHQRKGD